MSNDLGGMPPWPFSIVRVLKDAVQIVRSTLEICAAAVVADIVLWHVAFVFVDDVAADESGWWNFIFKQAWSSITGGLITAIVTYSALVALSGSRPLTRDAARGLSFAVGVTAVLFVGNAPILCLELFGAMEPNPGRDLLPQLAMVLVAYVLTVLWFAAAPALVTEGLGPLAALRRSVALTAGQRWPLFGLVVALALTSWGLQWALTYLGNALNAQVGRTEPNFIIYWVADYVVPAVGLAVWAVVQTAAYYALRTAKEGTVTAELARVFD